MAGETDNVSQVALGAVNPLSFGLGHPEKRRNPKGYSQKIAGKRPIPGDRRQQAANRVKHKVSNTIQKYLQPLAADLLISFEQITDQNDCQRDHSAIGDALDGSEDEQPGESWSEGHGGTENSINYESPCQKQPPSKIGRAHV